MSLREIILTKFFPKLEDLTLERLSVAIDFKTSVSYENLFDSNYIWF